MCITLCHEVILLNLMSNIICYKINTTRDTMDYCRLCLVKDSDKIEILNPNHGEGRVRRMIKVLFSLEIEHTIENGFSTKICLKCLENVQNFYKFRHQVMKTQKHLKRNIYLKGKERMQDTGTEEHKSERLELKNEIEKQINHLDLEVIKREQLVGMLDGNISQETCNSPKSIEYPAGNPQLIHEIFLKPELPIDNNSTLGNNIGEFLLKSEADQSFIVNDYEEIDHYDSLIDISENITPHKTRNKQSKSRHSKDDDLLINIIEGKDSLNGFNTEIYKHGKLAIKGQALQILVTKFYNLHCDLCEISPQFSGIQKLFTHYKTIHGSDGYVTCCNKRIFLCRNVYLHMARHLQPSAFQCSICKKEVSRPNIMKNHLRIHLPEAEKPHKCDQCDRRYSCRTGLIQHQLSHVPIKARNIYKCEICEKQFNLLSSYTCHMSVVHSGLQFLCSECGKVFKTKIALKTHSATHDPEGKNKTKCKHCDTVCKNRASLLRHMKTHSSKNLHCDICDFKTSQKKRIVHHMKIKHSNLKPYQCFLCGKDFKLRWVLKTHQAQHTGERKYACAFCPKTFVSSGNYSTHNQRMHADQYYNATRKKKILELMNPNLQIDLGESEEIKAKNQEIARQQIKELERSKNK